MDVTTAYAVEVDLPCDNCDHETHNGVENWTTLTGEMMEPNPEHPFAAVAAAASALLGPAIFTTREQAESVKDFAVNNWPQYRWRLVCLKQWVRVLPTTLYTPDGYATTDDLTDESIVEFMEGE